MSTGKIKKEAPEFLRKYFFFSLLDWERLPPNERDELEKSKKILKLRKNEIVFEEGSHSRGVYILLKGKVKIFQRLPDGTQQLFFVYVEDEVFGFRPMLCNEAHPTSAAALEPSQLAFIPAEVFQKVLKGSPVLANMLLFNLSREFSIWINRITAFARKDVKQRLALLLLVFNERFKTQNSKTETSIIRISRTDLAASIGTSLETLVRTLKKFSDSRMIRVQGKTIVITNAKQLIAEAGI